VTPTSPAAATGTAVTSTAVTSAAVTSTTVTSTTVAFATGTTTAASTVGAVVPASTATAGAAASDTASGTASGTTPGGSTGATGSSVASAADLLADEAAIAVAEQEVAVARAQLELLTLTSPIAGTVADVTIRAGGAVSAGSSEATITVIGESGYLVSTTVPLTSVDAVEVGQRAQLSVATTDEPLTATVSSIGLLDVSETSTPAFTVLLAVTPDVTLWDGSQAQVDITVSSDEQVLSVPTSAVHVEGSDATVDVLVDGAVQAAPVEVGAVGAELTEISAGLDAGATVILADSQTAIESETSTSTGTGLSGLGGSSSIPQRGAGAVPPGGGLSGGAPAWPAGG